MTDAPATKKCKTCGETKGLLEFNARRHTCRACEEAKRAKQQERKQRVEITPAVEEKILDLVATGSTVSEIGDMPGMPTAQAIARHRRRTPEFADALDVSRAHRASVRSDRIDGVLRDLRQGRIDPSSARVALDGEFRLAALEDSKRYNPATKAEQEISAPGGMPLIESSAGDGLRALANAICWLLRDASFEAAVAAKAIEAQALPPPPAPQPAAPAVPESEDVELEFDPYDSSLNVVPLFGRREG